MNVLDSIRAFIRLEITEEELEKVTETVEEPMVCVVPLEDWLVLYEKMNEMKISFGEFMLDFGNAYFNLASDFYIELFEHVDSEAEKLRRGLYFIEAMNDLLCYEYAEEFCQLTVEEALDRFPVVNEAYHCVKQNATRPFEDMIFPNEIKEDYIRELRHDLKGKREEEIVLYRKFVEDLCVYDNLTALEAKAYGCYGGDEAFACDWITSRDCLLKLMEIHPEEQKKAVYANTLGYIYYYGRCNDGVPEYEKAFSMYSLGAAGGMIESMYKLADLYKGGKGVVKNELAGENLVWWIFKRHYKDFLWGNGGKIADLALRIGTTEEKHGNQSSALYYLTMADYAIRKRLPEEHYGDQKVFESIQEKLAEVRRSTFFEGGHKSITAYNPIALARAFDHDYVVEVTFKELKNSLKMTAVRRRKPSRTHAQQIEVTFPEYGYYQLQDSIVEHASGNLQYETQNRDMKFFTDYMEWDEEKHTITFWLFDDVVATVTAEKFFFRFPEVDWTQK